KARPAAADAVQRLREVGHPQVSVLETGKARIDRVFCGRRRTHRHGHRGRSTQCRMRGGDLLENVLWQLRTLDPGPHLLATGGDRGEILWVERFDARTNRRPLLQRTDKVFECARLDHKARWHGDARALQLSEAATLTPHVGTVMQSDVGEPADDLSRGHDYDYCRMVTTPRPPSTRIRWPSLIREVALPVPTTAGSPYSRATMAAWLIEPPMSETAPTIFWKMGAQVGLVTWHTRISPFCRRAISSTDLTMRAGPSTTPLEAAKPRTSLPSESPLADSHASRLSRVIPQSMTIAGSSMTSGTGPSAGGVSCFAHSRMAALRSATIWGQ